MTTKRENQLAVRGTVEKRVRESASLLERMGISAEAYERVVLNALIRNPQLQDCDRTSLDIAVADCIQAGLLPDGKQAAIVPVRDRREGKVNASFWPMIEGRTMLARKATPGLVIRARVVYEDDEFDYNEGTAGDIVHKPKRNADKRDEKVVAVYAMAKLPGATEWEWEVFDRGDIDRYRTFSKSDNVWKTHFAEMAKRGPLGRLLKRLPKDPRAPQEPDFITDSMATGLDFGSVSIIEGESSLPAVDTDTGEIISRENDMQEHTDRIVEEPKAPRKPRQPVQAPPPEVIDHNEAHDSDPRDVEESELPTDYDPEAPPF